jgi:DNA-directed RNA polymerase specialized sigma54-like protein
MALKQTLAPAQKQTLKMSFSMRQSLKVLALNGMDLCAYTAKQLEDNPAAEPEFLEFGYASAGESDLAAASGPGLQESHAEPAAPAAGRMRPEHRRVHPRQLR